MPILKMLEMFSSHFASSHCFFVRALPCGLAASRCRWSRWALRVLCADGGGAYGRVGGWRRRGRVQDLLCLQGHLHPWLHWECHFPTFCPRLGELLLGLPRSSTLLFMVLLLYVQDFAFLAVAVLRARYALVAAAMFFGLVLVFLVLVSPEYLVSPS